MHRAARRMLMTPRIRGASQPSYPQGGYGAGSSPGASMGGGGYNDLGAGTGPGATLDSQGGGYNDSYVPAPIRHNNPGGMWPGHTSRAFGATGQERIGGGNLIATFPDPVSGAAAQFSLLNDPLYRNRTFIEANKDWPSALEAARAAGINPNTRIGDIVSGPDGLRFAQAQAKIESGRDFPLTGEQWAQAQSMAFGGNPPQPVANSTNPAVGTQTAGVPTGAPSGVAGVPSTANPQTAGLLGSLLGGQSGGANPMMAMAGNLMNQQVEAPKLAPLQPVRPNINPQALQQQQALLQGILNPRFS